MLVVLSLPVTFLPFMAWAHFARKPLRGKGAAVIVLCWMVQTVAWIALFAVYQRHGLDGVCRLLGAGLAMALLYTALCVGFELVFWVALRIRAGWRWLRAQR